MLVALEMVYFGIGLKCFRGGDVVFRYDGCFSESRNPGAVVPFILIAFKSSTALVSIAEQSFSS